jgi:hypothetical protein
MVSLVAGRVLNPPPSDQLRLGTGQISEALVREGIRIVLGYSDAVSGHLGRIPETPLYGRDGFNAVGLLLSLRTH